MLKGLFGKKVTVRIKDENGLHNDMVGENLYYDDMKYYNSLIEMGFLKFKSVVFDEYSEIYFIDLEEI